MEEPIPSPEVPAGWYPDDAWGRERYWDGLAWTEETRDRVIPEEPKPTIAGFWRRTAAFVLDGMLLGAVGLALGFGLFDLMSGLGAWGRLVGFGIELVYFGLLDSSIGRGQTLGKRLLKIRVADGDGSPLPVWKAMLRFTILAGPVFFNNLALPVDPRSLLINIVIGLVVFGLGSISAYLYLFNRSTRQSVHDLATGAFVIRAEAAGPVEARMWRGHLAICAALLALVVAGMGATALLAKKLPEGLYDAVAALNASGKVHTASVFIGKAWGDEGTVDYVRINAVVAKRPDDPRKTMDELVEIVIEEYPQAEKVDSIGVDIVYGFDLGIASGWRREGFNQSPAAWTGAVQEN